MNAINRFVDRVHKKGLLDTLGASFSVATGALDYWLNPFAVRQGRIVPQDYDRIRSDLISVGLHVVDYRVDVADFQAWLNRADFGQAYCHAYGQLFREKAFEHYLGAELLQLSADDVFIDVAAAKSPWYRMVPDLYGCRESYCLDLDYPPGIHGWQIGADATATPLTDGFASRIALHCAYETFEGSADTRLPKEAARLLRPGGRMVILPLYLHNFYFIDVGPYADRRGLNYQGARRVWREDIKGLRFSRKYSVASFADRVVSNLNGLDLTIFFVTNITEAVPNGYCRFAALFTNPGDIPS